MARTVELPLWVLIGLVVFAAVTFASHFLLPSVRWFFRKRMERVVSRLNTRLERPIEPFKLARRYDMIQRLIYDPEVSRAIHAHAQRNGVPENVAFERARGYAREIVPSFSATMYFSVGARLSRWLSRTLYRVRVGQFDRGIYEAIDPEATIVFMINHRSNMDYVLVTYLVSRASALSYAVGEWARIWPLSWLIRMMGAYFIRRRYRGELYRKVLARYVQLATEGGVTQAVFPEGGLSLDGRLSPPKLGILSYVVNAYQEGTKNVVLVPVALNYDHILEDKILIEADRKGERRFRAPVGLALRRLMQHLWRKVTGRFERFGGATVSFGEPLSLRAVGDIDIEQLGEEVMTRIARVVPILPVPLVSRALHMGARGQEEVESAVEVFLSELHERGIRLPRRTPSVLVRTGLEHLQRRGIVTETGEPEPDQDQILMFYARSIEHHFE